MSYIQGSCLRYKVSAWIPVNVKISGNTFSCMNRKTCPRNYSFLNIYTHSHADDISGQFEYLYFAPFSKTWFHSNLQWLWDLKLHMCWNFREQYHQFDNTSTLFKSHIGIIKSHSHIHHFLVSPGNTFTLWTLWRNVLLFGTNMNLNWKMKWVDVGETQEGYANST